MHIALTDSMLSKAMQYPMQVIAVLYIRYNKAMDGQLSEWLSIMFGQIQNIETAVGALSISEQTQFSLGLAREKMPFDAEKSLKARGISQQRLMDELGVSRTTIFRWLNDTPKNKKTEIEIAIYKISKEIGDEFEYIAGNDNN